jgi:fructokinase
MELYVSGRALETDYRRRGGERVPAQAVVARARAGDEQAAGALADYIDRLGRGLAVICNLVDPDVIVLGGGMSNVEELYARTPTVIGRRLFSDVFDTPLVAAAHGDSSGVRGAAWLWP